MIHRSIPLVLVVITCVSGACAREQSVLEIARQQTDYVHWSYDGADGPETWGGLDTHYRVCGGGPYQSPVSLSAERAAPHSTDLRVVYRPLDMHAVNNGHTVQLNTESATEEIYLNDHPYRLIQLHFHAPSEHVLDGNQTAMEVHLVHVDEYDHLAVVGVPMVVGPANTVLAPLFDDMPTAMGEHVDKTTVSIDLPRLVSDTSHFLHYLGSLTTPPCTENVQWLVMETPITVSEAQVDKFLNVVHKNARPVQPLNNRLIDRNVVRSAAPPPATEDPAAATEARSVGGG